LTEKNLEQQIKDLKRKRENFIKAGDLSRATHCNIIAEFLEEFVVTEGTSAVEVNA
jgi:hypothetical protein